MKLGWTWEIDHNGELAFEVTRTIDGNPVVLSFGLTKATILEELMVDIHRSAIENDPEALDEWVELRDTFKRLVEAMDTELNLK